MTKQPTLTAVQLERLAPYLKHFTTATQAAWCPYPGETGINTMLAVWQELTGVQYHFRPGCSACLLGLVRDLGTVYFQTIERQAVKDLPVKGAETPADETKPAKAGKSSTTPENAGKSALKPKSAKPKKK